MLIKFEEIKIRATKTIIGEDGKKCKRSKTFIHTINPFNKNPDGTIKNRHDIMDSLMEEVKEWKKI